MIGWIIFFFLMIALVVSLVLYTFCFFKENESLKKKIEELKRIANIKDELFQHCRNELLRVDEQIKIFEQNELERDDVIIYGEKQKKTNIYKGKRALVGDYNADSSEHTRKILLKLGMNVDVVRTGDDLFEKVCIYPNHQYDVIFTNYEYQKGDSGLATLRKLQSRINYNVPVILLSIEKKDKEYYCNACGFYDFLQKPLKEEELLKVLNKIFDKNEEELTNKRKKKKKK